MSTVVDLKNIDGKLVDLCGKYIGHYINDIDRGDHGYNADYILNNINFNLPKGSYLYLFKIYNGLYHKNDYSQETPFYNIEYKNIILQ